MTEQTSNGAAASDDGGHHDQADSTDARLSHVESAVERIENTLARLVPTSHREAESRVERRLSSGTTVEDQVRAELARAKAEQDQAAAADAEKSERETMREQLAKLQERPPEPPVRRATKVLGWGSR